jgi:hypothetical protein
VEDCGDPDSFTKIVKTARSQLLKETKARAKKRELTRLFETLEAECVDKAPLQHVGLEILNQSDFRTLSRKHLINRVAIQAATYYQDIWQCCSDHERLTLFHLAQDRLLSPKDHDIEPLMRRGLIAHKPDLRLMNESFKRFVKNEKGAQVIAKYEEKAREDSLWHSLRIPLVLVLVSLIGFLFIAQPELYNSSLALMTAITTIIPAFFTLLGALQKQPDRRDVQKSFFGRTEN